MKRNWGAVGEGSAAFFLILAIATGCSARAGAAPPDLDRVLRDLEARALEVWNPQEVPGFAYAVVKGGELVYARGFGNRSAEPTSGPVDERTLFEIGSCTKAFNAAAVGTVVDEGKAAWGDRVRDHLPEFKMYDRWVSREFLIEDLMAQRSGMPPYALDTMSFLGFGRKDLMRAVRFVEPATSFRSQFGYQNNLHLWAADLIEEKTGLRWEEAVRRRILEPLGMTDSTFDAATYDAEPNHAMGHIPLDAGGLWTIPSDWPYRSWLTVYAPAGGLMSNLADMAKWVAFQLGDGSVGGRVILRPETVQTIRAPRILRAASAHSVASYAMGWVFQSSAKTSWYVHDGETAGMHSIVAVYPQGDLGLVVLTNQSGNHLPESLALRLYQLYFEDGAQASLPPGDAGVSPMRPGLREGATAPEAAAAIPANQLLGTYENPAYGKAVVKRDGGELALVMGPAKRHGSLSPLGANRYLFQWSDWPGMTSVATFTADGSGAVTKMNLQGFEDVRGGDFRRKDG